MAHATEQEEHEQDGLVKKLSHRGDFSYFREYMNQQKEIHFLSADVDEEDKQKIQIWIDDEEGIELPYGMLLDLAYYTLRYDCERHRKRITCKNIDFGDPVDCNHTFYVYYNRQGVSQCPKCNKSIFHQDDWFKAKKEWRKV